MQPTGIELGISFPPCRRRTRSCLAKPDKMISLFGKITGKMSSEKCLWGNNTYHPKWTVVHIPRPHTHILSNVDSPGFPQRWYSQSWNTLIWTAFSAFLRWSFICMPFAVFLSSSVYFLPIYLLPPRLLQLRLRVWLQLQRRRLLLQLYDDDYYYNYTTTTTTSTTTTTTTTAPPRTATASASTSATASATSTATSTAGTATPTATPTE